MEFSSLIGDVERLRNVQISAESNNSPGFTLTFPTADDCSHFMVKEYPGDLWYDLSTHDVILLQMVSKYNMTLSM